MKILIGLEQLDALAAKWLDAERARGLIDVKFFPGSDRDVVDRDALNDFLHMMQCRENGEFTDITGKML